MNNANIALFVSCPPALEPILVDELTSFGLSSSSLHQGYRGVYVHNWDWSTIYQINYASRIASRVLLPISRFRCFDKRTLYRHAHEIDWTKYIKRGMTFAIDANVQHRELRNSLYAAQIVKDAICDQMRERQGWRPSVEIQDPDIQINLFIQHQNGVISFDTSGQPLHKRGYRQETVEAPIQESLAAAILHLAGYQAGDVLLDPCCGSGTILIEAALMASQTPPGYLRTKWGFAKHPSHDPSEWLKMRNLIDQKRIPLLPGQLYGMDRSASAVRAAKINLRAAGFSNLVEIREADLRDSNPTKSPTLIVANPPHGKRLEDEDFLRPLYRTLGNFMKEQCQKPGKGFIFTSSLALAKEVGLAAKKRYELQSGGLDARLLEFDLY